MLDLLTAIRTRYLATDLSDPESPDYLTGVYRDSADATAVRPYAIVLPGSRTPYLKSNKGRYLEEDVQIDVVHAESDEAMRLADVLQDAMLDPPLAYQTAGGRLMEFREGTTRHQREDEFWRSMVTFTARSAHRPWPAA